MDSEGLGDITGTLERMRGSKFFTSLDRAQAYHQLELKEEGKHKTAFGDPTRRLLESNICTSASAPFRLSSWPRSEMAYGNC